jgi:hypothetical protein
MAADEDIGGIESVAVSAERGGIVPRPDMGGTEAGIERLEVSNTGMDGIEAEVTSMVSAGEELDEVRHDGHRARRCSNSSGGTERRRGGTLGLGQAIRVACSDTMIKLRHGQIGRPDVQYGSLSIYRGSITNTILYCYTYTIRYTLTDDAD